MGKTDIGKLANEIRSTSLKIYNAEEHIAGLGDEREADRLEFLLLEILGESVRVRKIWFDLMGWKLKEVDVHPAGFKTLVAPYVEKADVEGKVWYIKGDPSEPPAWRGFPEDYIALAMEPPNPDEVKAAALLAAEHGARALLLESKGRPRKIVTTGTWGYSYYSGAPTPIPVAYVERGFISRALREGYARIYVNAYTTESRGVILEFDHGWDAGLPVIGAHYDRWLSCFQDDILGIAQAAYAFKIIASESGARLLLFSAEEHGTPGYAGWYWAWGSRWYVREMERSGLLDDIGLYINFDLAGAELRASGSPQIVSNIAEQVTERCCECPECDSFSFAAAGVPTLSMHSLWDERVRSIYHSTDDSPSNVDYHNAAKAVVLAVKAALSRPVWGEFSRRILEWLGSAGLLGRRAAVLIEGIAARVGWDALYRELARRFLKPVNYGDYRWATGDLEALWFPEAVIYQRLLRDLDSGTNPLEVWIAGEERLLYTTMARGGRPLGKPGLAWQAKSTLEELNRVLEEIQKALIG